MEKTPAIWLALVATLCAANTATAQERSPFHVELDVGYVNQAADYVSMTDVVPICPDGSPPENCSPTGRNVHLMRGIAGIGWGGLTLEAAIAMPVASELDLTQVGVGVRFDTSYAGMFSVYFRAHYLIQMGEIEGEGGHVGVGMQLWFIPQMSLYAEAAADLTSVPESMQSQGTLFSYARYFGGGLRFRFAPGG